MVGNGLCCAYPLLLVFGNLGHMALVSNNPGAQNGALGVITLEDVIEELIGEEIVDETDVYVDGK